MNFFFVVTGSIEQIQIYGLVNGYKNSCGSKRFANEGLLKRAPCHAILGNINLDMLCMHAGYLLFILLTIITRSAFLYYTFFQRLMQKITASM